MNPKPSLNHRECISALRNMTPEQRLKKALDLSEMTSRLFVHGLRRRFPQLGEQEFKRLLSARMEKCHNRNY